MVALGSSEWVWVSLGSVLRKIEDEDDRSDSRARASIKPCDVHWGAVEGLSSSMGCLSSVRSLSRVFSLDYEVKRCRC